MRFLLPNKNDGFRVVSRGEGLEDIELGYVVFDEKEKAEEEARELIEEAVSVHISTVIFYLYLCLNGTSMS